MKAKFPVLNLNLYASTLGAICLSTLIVGFYSRGPIGAEATDKVQILFTYEGPFQTVCLSGDFNDWSPNTHCLEQNGDIWKIKVFLSPGRYKYAFVLDGTHWTPDPNAFLLENDGFGMKNSVLIVE